MYLHTHQGSRAEGTYFVEFLARFECSLCVFDFAGAGQSGGEYTSFGFFESEQIKCMVDFLSTKLGFDVIGLWGKSMGGAATIMYCGKYPHPCVRFMVIDAAFDKLKHAILNIASGNSSAPQFAVKTFMLFVANTVKAKAGFDIYQVRPIDWVDKIVIPSLFVIGQEDNVVKKSEFFSLHAKCASNQKRLLMSTGDHTANRLDDPNFNSEALEFLGKFFPKVKSGVLKPGPSPANFIEETKTDNPLNRPMLDGQKILNSVITQKQTLDRKRLNSDEIVQHPEGAPNNMGTKQPSFGVLAQPVNLVNPVRQSVPGNILQAQPLFARNVTPNTQIPVKPEIFSPLRQHHSHMAIQRLTPLQWAFQDLLHLIQFLLSICQITKNLLQLKNLTRVKVKLQFRPNLNLILRFRLNRRTKPENY